MAKADYSVMYMLCKIRCTRQKNLNNIYGRSMCLLYAPYTFCYILYQKREQPFFKARPTTKNYQD